MNENQEKLALIVAETILANTKLLQALVDTLPKAVADVVTKVVAKDVKPAPVKPVVQEVVADVAENRPINPENYQPVIEVAPVVVPPVAVPAAVEAPATPSAVAPSGKAPFTDQTGLTKYVMGRYVELGPIKGAAIQECLSKIGSKNINDIPPAKYDELFGLVSAL